MNSDQINAFWVALCAPLDDQSERLVEALLDCEEPDSRWKRTCSEVRRQMTRQIQDRGFGRYSIGSICVNAIGEPDPYFGPAPPAVPTPVHFAGLAALLAICGREALIEQQYSDAIGFFYSLPMAVQAAEAADNDASVSTDIYGDDDFRLTVIKKGLQLLKGEDKRRRGRRQQLLEEYGIDTQNRNQRFGDIADDLIASGIPPHKLAMKTKEKSGSDMDKNTIRKILKALGKLPHLKN